MYLYHSMFCSGGIQLTENLLIHLLALMRLHNINTAPFSLSYKLQ
jgi:hypothetical protein